MLSVGGSASTGGCAYLGPSGSYARMKEDRIYSSYAELHRLFEERYNLHTTCNGLRWAMVRMFDYDWQELFRTRSPKRLIFKMPQFMIRYAGKMQYTNL